MPEFTIEWVGDEPREYDGINSWAVAGTDADGKRFTKTKYELPVSDGKPAVPLTVNGILSEHPRLENVKLLESVAGAINGSAPNTTEGHLTTIQTANDAKSAQINRAVAFKGAVEILANNNLWGAKTAVEVAGQTHALTEALLPIVEGSADPNGQAESPPRTNPGNQESVPVATDDDIPF